MPTLQQLSIGAARERRADAKDYFAACGARLRNISRLEASDSGLDESLHEEIEN